MYFQAFYEYFKDDFSYLRKEGEQLPSCLTCEKPNTMENDTVVRRIPNVILKRVEKQNEKYNEEKNIYVTLTKLRDLFVNANTCTHEMLQCKEDAKYWNFILTYITKNNFTIAKSPWLLNELYFYRYLSCIYDFENSYYDFFVYEKNNSINCNRPIIEQICTCTKSLIDLYNVKEDKKIFYVFFYFSLWSNQFDLSWNPTKNKNVTIEHTKDEKNITNKTLKEKKFYFDTDDIDKLHNSFFLENILTNDIDDLHRDITAKVGKRLDIVLDNMGVELVTDLCLLLFLSRFFNEVTIHVKKFPLFVSDTMEKDVHYALDTLSNDEKFPNTAFMAKQWKQLVQEGTWKIREDIYWNLPLPYWIFPNNLLEDMQKSSFVFFKGDANYRRCLGDLHFNFWEPSKNVLSYFPFRVLALRCLKSPLCCGVSKDVVEELNRRNPDWSNYGE